MSGITHFVAGHSLCIPVSCRNAEHCTAIRSDGSFSAFIISLFFVLFLAHWLTLSTYDLTFLCLVFGSLADLSTDVVTLPLTASRHGCLLLLTHQ